MFDNWTNPNAISDVFKLVTEPNWRSAAGVAGTVLGLPEMGVSEGGNVPASNQVPSSQPTPQPTPSPTPTPTGTPTSTKTTTQNTGTTQGSAGSYPADKYIGWDPASAQADWEAKWRSGQTGGSSGGGGSEPRWEDLISDAYSPALSALGGIEQNLQAGQTEGLAGVDKTYSEGGETIGREQGELESSLTEQGRRLAQSVRSAYSDALRSYNNLIQQGMARFGAGSSAGPAVQELVNQEFMRSRSRLGETAMQGEQQMAQEWTKLGNYVSQKKTELDQWKRNAVQQINDNFRNAMGEIAMRRGEIEANKTNARIAALQNAVAMARQVESEERQIRMNLAQFAVETMQNLSQRAFTPQEIASVVGQVMQAEIPGMVNRASASAGTTTSPYAYYNPYSSRKATEEEAAKANS
jgi:hypothetical protein